MFLFFSRTCLLLVFAFCSFLPWIDYSGHTWTTFEEHLGGTFALTLVISYPLFIDYGPISVVPS